MAGPPAQEKKGLGPSQSFCSPQRPIVLIAILKRWRGLRQWPWGGGCATAEPIGLGPSAPGAFQCPPAGRMPRGIEHPSWIPGRGQTLSQAPLGGSATWGGRGCGGGWKPSPELHNDTAMTVHAARRASLSCPTRMAAGTASAPGVPGGSASAEAVAALPDAVDEAQGVLELLAGGFLDGLVREVHLVDGFPP